MNSLAQKLNETIAQENAHVYEMLSELGRQIYFPKEGILSQSAERRPKQRNSMLPSEQRWRTVSRCTSR